MVSASFPTYPRPSLASISSASGIPSAARATACSSNRLVSPVVRATAPPTASPSEGPALTALTIASLGARRFYGGRRSVGTTSWQPVLWEKSLRRKLPEGAMQTLLWFVAFWAPR